MVQYQEKMHSDLPETTLRGYVQLETSVVTGIGYPLPNGKTGVDQPHFLGPTIVAQQDRPVRITFYNLLPNWSRWRFFVCRSTRPSWARVKPKWTCRTEPRCPLVAGTVMDMVRNPHCSDKSMRDMCFTDNRETLHLHGGNVPWISDGTPHQWITPAGENTMWPEGVSVESVPDMVGNPAGGPIVPP